MCQRKRIDSWPFSAKTNYHLSNLQPLLLRMSPLMSLFFPPSRSLLSLNLSSRHLTLERKAMEESSEEKVEEAGGVCSICTGLSHRAYLILLSVPIPPTTFSMSFFIYTAHFFSSLSFSSNFSLQQTSWLHS